MGLILIPSEVINSGNIIRQTFTDALEKYKAIWQCIQNFANEGELDTDTWNVFKEKILNYHQLIASGIVAASDGIQEEMNTISQTVGTEELYEDDLLEKIKVLEDEKEELLIQIQRLQELNNNWFIVATEVLRSSISNMIMKLELNVENINQVVEVLQKKLDFLYDVESQTSSMLVSNTSVLIAVRNLINNAGVELTGNGTRIEGNWEIIVQNACRQMDERIIIFIENSLRSELHIELSDLKKTVW